MNTNQLNPSMNSRHSYDLRWRSSVGSDNKIDGKRLLLALSVTFVVMAVAIVFAIKLSSDSGYLWPGFLPLFIGWAGLYPLFKRLETPKRRDYRN